MLTQSDTGSAYFTTRFVTLNHQALIEFNTAILHLAKPWAKLMHLGTKVGPNQDS